jgi:molybdopterin converting factor small subunit
MTVELFGTARLRAGIASIDLSAQTLGEAIERLALSVPKLANSVVLGNRVHPSFKLSLNGDRFVSDPLTPLAEGDRLLLISADAGG